MELTAVIAPAATQPVATLGIHNRSACLAHSRRRWRTGRKRRRRAVGRAVAEADQAGVGAAVEVLAFDVVLGAAMAAGTAAAVVVSRDLGTGRYAGAGTGDAAYGVATDVDLVYFEVSGRICRCTLE